LERNPGATKTRCRFNHVEEVETFHEGAVTFRGLMPKQSSGRPANDVSPTWSPLSGQIA